MNISWLLLYAVGAASLSVAGVLWLGIFRRAGRARESSSPVEEATSTPATERELVLDPALAGTLNEQQEQWESRIERLHQTLLGAQRVELEALRHEMQQQSAELRREMQQQSAELRRESERIEDMWRKERLHRASGRSSGKRAQTAATPAAIGLLTLEVNGLRKEYPVVPNARMTLGRGPGNDIVLQDMRLSETHVAFRSDDSRTFVEPLGAAHPVLINGRRLVKPTALQAGDVLGFSGNCRLTFTGPVKEKQGRAVATLVPKRRAG